MKDVMIIGCGYMGKEYTKVLKALGITPIVVGRGEENANKFSTELGISVITGGVDKALLEIKTIPYYAIVCVGVDLLKNTTESLLKKGVKNILVEKPAGLNSLEIRNLHEKAVLENAKVFVAYNRRFYASTEKAIEIIKIDCGVSSFNFEFTEWSSTIEQTNHAAVVKENWLLANSSHVIDLAFFLGGQPKEMRSFVNGELPWHHSGSSYVGAGITDCGALFSYQANWEAPGRWGLEVLTKTHRLYFRPMEKLQIQGLNSTKIENVSIDDKLDTEFKPGLYKQVDAFLNNQDDKRLLTIGGQLEHMKIYEQIAGK